MVFMKYYKGTENGSLIRINENTGWVEMWRRKDVWMQSLTSIKEVERYLEQYVELSEGVEVKQEIVKWVLKQ
jgi:hypothetical protein